MSGVMNHGLWGERFARLARYANEHGNAAPAKSYRDADDFSLGKWVHKQRHLFKTGKLSAQRIERLESLPGWVWEECGWRIGFKHLTWFVEQTGMAEVPTSYRTPDGYLLGAWAARRRYEHRDGTLSAERITALEALPLWSWYIEPNHVVRPNTKKAS